MSTHPKPSTDTDPPASDTEFEIGDTIVDGDQADPDHARVINLPGIPCKKWDAYVDEDGEPVTVADDNPNYDPDADVVVCLFVEQLAEHYPDWDGSYPLELAEVSGNDITHYGFPPDRLDRIEDDADEAGEPPEPPAGLEELADDLRPGAAVDMSYRDGEHVLEVEKLGATYTIDKNGDVEGSGPHADPLQDKATSFLN